MTTNITINEDRDTLEITNRGFEGYDWLSLTPKNGVTFEVRLDDLKAALVAFEEVRKLDYDRSTRISPTL
jgi:hypothetical protein